jgi:acetyl-CoA carboxylase biotin carboxyl carrier protein
MIEAMKLMNELVAPRDGVVKEICVEDGELAEYGQILMWLE